MHRYIAAAGKISAIVWAALIGGATCAVILFVAIRLLMPSSDPWTSGKCDRGSEVQPAISPDQSLVARGIYLQCGGPMANTAANVVVVVKKGQEPTSADEVFSGAWGYTNQVKLAWKSDKVLQITLPDDALVYAQKAALGDIAVLIKFESDDPQVRERALRKREGR